MNVQCAILYKKCLFFVYLKLNVITSNVYVGNGHVVCFLFLIYPIYPCIKRQFSNLVGTMKYENCFWSYFGHEHANISCKKDITI